MSRRVEKQDKKPAFGDGIPEKYSGSTERPSKSPKLLAMTEPATTPKTKRRERNRKTPRLEKRSKNTGALNSGDDEWSDSDNLFFFIVY